MSETNAFKLLEAGVLLAAGIAFGWWQLRDVAKARQASRAAAKTVSKQPPEPASEPPHQQAGKQQVPEPEEPLTAQSDGHEPQHSRATPGPQRDT